MTDDRERVLSALREGLDAVSAFLRQLEREGK